MGSRRRQAATSFRQVQVSLAALRESEHDLAVARWARQHPGEHVRCHWCGVHEPEMLCYEQEGNHYPTCHVCSGDISREVQKALLDQLAREFGTT